MSQALNNAALRHNPKGPTGNVKGRIEKFFIKHLAGIK